MKVRADEHVSLEIVRAVREMALSSCLGIVKCI